MIRYFVAAYLAVICLSVIEAVAYDELRNWCKSKPLCVAAYGRP